MAQANLLVQFDWPLFLQLISLGQDLDTCIHIDSCDTIQSLLHLCLDQVLVSESKNGLIGLDHKSNLDLIDLLLIELIRIKILLSVTVSATEVSVNKCSLFKQNRGLKLVIIKIYGNNLNDKEKAKFLGIALNSKLRLGRKVDD
ncbi:hypothetical protein BpHYR1_025877 [Brachionus plicatilis]|uniref:Uncharacterized protein n=1 Tax=Brachionus plicatilis TaxID=10195 RepID=A0A3M7P4I7_BRAPC|nr:hypothetical protein BpHYR1_025877 [Brachionus plicatilis]